jgi:hypothetical protein
MRRGIMLGFLLVGSWGMATPVRAATLYVKHDAAGTNDGTSWGDAYVSLQSALATATVGDQIWVAAGVYQPSAPGGRDATFALVSDVAVYGGFVGAETALTERNWTANVTVLSGDIDANDTVDGNGVTTAIAGSNAYSVVTADGVDATAVLDGFTICGGQSNGVGGDWFDSLHSGGGIHNAGGTPVLANLVVAVNYAEYGAGMYNYVGGDATLTDVVFRQNTAGNFGTGGGMYNYQSSPSLSGAEFLTNTATNEGGGLYNYASNPTIRNATFSGNYATNSGGGMFNSFSSPTITGSLFSGNGVTNWHGGGMYNNGGAPVIRDSVFIGNAAKNGGGMANDASAPALDGVDFIANSVSGGTGNGGGVWNNLTNPCPSFRNVVFSRNTAQYSGGGMYNHGSWGTLTNATFAGNSASDGGALFNTNNSNPPINNCIFWDNSASGSGAQIYNQGTNPTIRASDIAGCGGSGVGWVAGFGTDGGGNLDDDPLFVDAGDDDLRLASDSPAIDAGDDSLVPGGMTTDRNGNARISGLAVDMGAFEVQVPSLAPGLVSTIAAADVISLATFHLKPKVYGQYDHPVVVGKLGLKAAAKVLTKVEKTGTLSIDCEWTKKIKLYDAKAFKAAQKVGESAEAWVPANQENRPVVLHVASKEIADGDQVLHTAMLSAPEILTATVVAADGVTTVTFEGNWFGTKGLKASREYEVDDGAGGTVIKQQKMKILKPTEADAFAGFVDSKGKPAFMNAATGASKAMVIVTAKAPKGVLNGTVVLDNGVGMAAEALE